MILRALHEGSRADVVMRLCRSELDIVCEVRDVECFAESILRDFAPSCCGSSIPVLSSLGWIESLRSVQVASRPTINERVREVRFTVFLVGVGTRTLSLSPAPETLASRTVNRKHNLSY